MAELVQHLINGLAAGTIYALVALGYTMVYGVLKLINFAHGDVMMVGVYLGYATTRQMTPESRTSFLGVLLVFLVAMALCATLGFLIERFAYRPLREKPHLVALITAIGVSFTISYGFQLETKVGGVTVLPGASPKAFPQIIEPNEWLIFGDHHFTVENRELEVSEGRASEVVDPALEALWRSLDACVKHAHDDTGAPVLSASLAVAADGTTSLRALEPPGALAECARPVLGALKLPPGATEQTIRAKIGVTQDRDVVVWNWQIISVLIAVGLMLLLQYLVFKTRFGTAMRAVSFDHRTSALMGIPVDRIIALTFMLGSALAAGAGILYAIKDTLVQPLMGTQVGLKAFVAAVIGGIGHVPGAVVGALLLGLVEEFVVGYGSSTWRDAVAFGFLIVVLLFKPEGLFGKVTAEKV